MARIARSASETRRTGNSGLARLAGLMIATHPLGRRARLTRLLLALLLLLPQLTVAQTSASKASPRKPLVVTGSSTIYPLMTDIARRFEGLNPDIVVDLRS